MFKRRGNMVPGVRGEPAFTLAELLVVVAVIALLLSVAMPALTGARRRAKIAECAARLHAAGRGLAMYGTENAGLYPVTEMPFEAAQVELVAALSPDHVPDGKAFYCPDEADPDVQYSEENFREARIGYFYYSCRQAAPYSSPTSKLLRNFGALTPNWPRAIDAAMPPGTWVMSDRWIAGLSAHPIGQHGMNRLALDGSVTMVADRPAQAFK